MMTGSDQDRIQNLQQRGKRRIVTSDSKELLVEVDQTRCMGAESCLMVAPQVFALDPGQLGLFRRGNQPLGLKPVSERVIDSETIIIAAKSCPYRAIHVRDLDNEEELAGDPI